MLKTTKVTFKILRILALAIFTLIAVVFTMPFYIITIAFGQPIKLRS